MSFRTYKKALKALTATGSAGVLLSVQVCPAFDKHEQTVPHAAHPDHAPVPTVVVLQVVTTSTTSFG